MKQRDWQHLYRRTKIAFVFTGGLGLATFLLNVANTLIEQLSIKAGILALSTAGMVWGIFGIGAVVLLVSLVSLVSLPKLARQIGAVADEIGQKDLPSRPFLITGISAATNIAPSAESAGRGPLYMNLADWGPPRLKEALNEPFKSTSFTNWQQNLRVLAACPGVTHVYVLENDRSEFDLFQKVMKTFFPALIFRRIQDRNPSPDGAEFTLSSRRGSKLEPDYEDFQYVNAGIDRAFEMIGEEHKLKPLAVEKQCFLDATPGKKTLSIMSALASVNRPILFVYCSTELRDGRDKNSPWEVVAYDITMEIRQNQSSLPKVAEV